MSAKNKPNEIYLTRIYDAPVKLVWDAWCDPKQAAQWWGPRGWSITTNSKDLRPGGTWDYIMHGPNGERFHNITKYHEVVENSRLVYDHGGNDLEERGPLFRVTVVFTPMKDDKTQMEMTMALATAEAAEQTKKFIKQASGNSTWDRLSEYLEKETKGNEPFILQRSFNAPIQKVFEMWTNAEHFEKWLPPTGMTMKNTHVDIREGGSIVYCMGNDQMKMYGKIEYLKIEKPHFMQYLQNFSDEKGNVIRAPFSGTWPLNMKVSLTFTAEENNQTRVKVQTDIDKNSTPEELLTFTGARTSMTFGWNGSLDKLEELLS